MQVVAKRKNRRQAADHTDIPRDKRSIPPERIQEGNDAYASLKSFIKFPEEMAKVLVLENCTVAGDALYSTLFVHTDQAHATLAPVSSSAVAGRDKGKERVRGGGKSKKAPTGRAMRNDALGTPVLVVGDASSLVYVTPLRLFLSGPHTLQYRPSRFNNNIGKTLVMQVPLNTSDSHADAELLSTLKNLCLALSEVICKQKDIVKRCEAGGWHLTPEELADVFFMGFKAVNMEQYLLNVRWPHQVELAIVWYLWDRLIHTLTPMQTLLSAGYATGGRASFGTAAPLRRPTQRTGTRTPSRAPL